MNATIERQLIANRSIPKSDSTWSLAKGIGLAVLLLGDIVLLIGQARFEIRLLTDLDPDSFSWTHTAILVVGTLAFAFLSWSFASWVFVWLDDTFPNPDRLFRQLCALHDLDAKDRERLTELAQQIQIDDPSELFINASNWKNLQPTPLIESSTIERLRQRIFG